MNEQITTAAELDALPIDSILRSMGGYFYLRTELGWQRPGEPQVFTATHLITYGPVTLYRPDQPVTTKPTVEAYSVEQIREAFAKHAAADDWGVPAFYENGLIASLRGEYDRADRIEAQS